MSDISIHALREESDPVRFAAVSRSKISIHALREESDMPPSQPEKRKTIFQSTPSVRRATSKPLWNSAA